MILDKVNFPSDLKTLSFDEMKTLAGEIRELIIKKWIQQAGIWAQI